MNQILFESYARSIRQSGFLGLVALLAINLAGLAIPAFAASWESFLLGIFTAMGAVFTTYVAAQTALNRGYLPTIWLILMLGWSALSLACFMSGVCSAMAVTAQ